MFLLRILLMKVVFSNHFLKSPFSNLTFQSQFPKRMWFLSRFRLNPLKNHIPFENLAREGGILKLHFQIWLFKADFQKDCRFWVDLGLIFSKTTFLLRILLVKVVFSNHCLKSPFSNLTFQSRFPKKMWFLKRFRLNLLKKHVPFKNSAREDGFLKSLSQITIFKSDFSELISKKNVVWE